jgi:hypothetical protein
LDMHQDSRFTAVSVPSLTFRDLFLY